jgi:hypothetical protein
VLINLTFLVINTTYSQEQYNCLPFVITSEKLGDKTNMDISKTITGNCNEYSDCDIFINIQLEGIDIDRLIHYNFKKESNIYSQIVQSNNLLYQYSNDSLELYKWKSFFSNVNESYEIYYQKNYSKSYFIEIYYFMDNKLKNKILYFVPVPELAIREENCDFINLLNDLIKNVLKY